MDQKCPNCGFNYDYFDRRATVVCQNNHIICGICVTSLKQISENCPYCNATMVSSMSQNNGSVYLGQPLEYTPVVVPKSSPVRQNNPRPVQPQPQYPYQYQYNQPQPQPHIHVQVQPVDVVQQNKYRGVFGGLAFLCLMIFVALMAVMFQQSDYNNPSTGLIVGQIITLLFFGIFLQLCIGRRRRGFGYYNRL